MKHVWFLLGWMTVWAACGAAGDNPLSPPTTTLAVDNLCDTYCVLLWQHCKDAWRPYPSPQACSKACASLDHNGSIGDTEGDTLQCRLTYTLYAREHNESTLCRFAGPQSIGACSPSS